MVGMDPTQPCQDPCAEAAGKDKALANGARDLSSAYGQDQVSRPGTDCATRAPGMTDVANRFDRYGAALPSARAANDLNQLQDKDAFSGSAPDCLERLPLNADALNRELGIPADSPNAITDQDLRNDKIGHRSAIFRSKADGRLIMVSRDTQPDTLVDWKTNIDNGRGMATDQYAATRRLATKMNASGQTFDIGGYSKGGGLAQEAGLLSPNSNVYVFNSAGLHENSLGRTGQAGFDDLARRTSSFSAEEDFLTFMNTTTDPAREVRNAEYLRGQLAGDNWPAPMEILYENPEHKELAGKRSWFDGDLRKQKKLAQEAFEAKRQEFFESVDEMINSARATEGYDRLFPPVRSGTHDTIPNSMTWTSRRLGAEGPEASLGKLNQHKMDKVLPAMETQHDADRATLQKFLDDCGS